MLPLYILQGKEESRLPVLNFHKQNQQDADSEWKTEEPEPTRLLEPSGKLGRQRADFGNTILHDLTPYLYELSICAGLPTASRCVRQN